MSRGADLRPAGVARIRSVARALGDWARGSFPGPGELAVPDDDWEGLTEAELVDRLASTQLLTAAAAAEAHDGARLPAAERVGCGPRPVDPTVETARMVALARNESPSKGMRLLGVAKALVNEMPHTFNAVAAGRLNEWRATLVVRETACLSLEDRVAVDEAMVPVYARGGVGDRQLAAEARARAQRLDPAAAVKRARKAAAERRVSVRPAPDAMAYLTCLVPAAQGIAAYKALCTEADSARATGGNSPEGRTREQIMVDTAIERLTGQKAATDVPLEVQLIMTDTACLGGSAEPALLGGFGPIPAQIARDLVLDAHAKVMLRRLYTAPAGGGLVAMESRARIFPEGLKTFIALRDRVCLNPWCGAPLRQYDHIQPVSRGGPTSAQNGQGLCEQCNQAKDAPGWSETTAPATRHTVTVTTPTGHTYSSTAPPLPGSREVIGHRIEFPGGEYVFHTAA